MRLVNKLTFISTLFCALTLTETASTRPKINLEQAPMITAGMATTFTQKFFDEYRYEVMDLFEKNLNDLVIPDANADFNLGLGKVYL